ncbi:MAG: methionyl-tRNA formyltransferase [Spirochaetaceae bacterium]|nr:methionyl-tRNA formyltransferase [Spirochaetaceae bacterium]
MRILFAGTAEIAVPSLQALSQHYEIAAVLTSTDKRGARGNALVSPPVKVAAEELGLPVLQFDHLGREARETVSKYTCDTLVCFAYGRLFGPKFLSLFPFEQLNIHPSLLPLLRGPSPIQGAILSQASESGISIQRIASAMDSGDLLLAEQFPLNGDETTGSLSLFVAERAADLAVRALRRLEDGTAVFSPQSGEATYTKLITPEMAELDFSNPAKALHAQIRAMMPWPKARTTYQGQTLLITGVHGTLDEAGEDPSDVHVPVGTVVAKQKKKGIAITTSEGLLWVTRLQLEKRKEMDWQSFLNGNQNFLGSKLR